MSNFQIFKLPQLQKLKALKPSQCLSICKFELGTKANGITRECFDLKKNMHLCECTSMVQWEEGVSMYHLLEMMAREHNKECKHIGPTFA
jgi:hypothetical protein